MEIKKRLRKSLTKTIEKWMDDECESSEWLALNTYIGNGTAEKMSDAAIAVLEGIADIHSWLRKGNQLRD